MRVFAGCLAAILLSTSALAAPKVIASVMPVHSIVASVMGDVGTPVLLSDLSSLRELKGPGAEVLPVDELDAWVQTCRRLLARRAVTQEPNLAARSWALQFSWNSSANRHLEIYRDVVTPGKNHG